MIGCHRGKIRLTKTNANYFLFSAKCVQQLLIAQRNKVLFLLKLLRAVKFDQITVGDEVQL